MTSLINRVLLNTMVFIRNKLFSKVIFIILFSYINIAISAIVFRDNFEYTVNRDNSDCTIFNSSGGWNTYKSNNCGSPNAYGYIYTTVSIPGYSQSFPGSNSSRVLAMEARPYTFQGQTDFFVQFGSQSSEIGRVPANHWIQFWVYANNYGSEQSRFSQGKWIYPSRTFYPATIANEGYVYMFGLSKYNSVTIYNNPCGGGDNVGCDRAYLYTVWNSNNGLVDNHVQGLTDQFGQNLNTEPPIMPNTWTLVKMHVDLSGTDPRAVPGQAVYEQWIKRQGSSQWIKTTEYIGGVTVVNNQPISLIPSHNDGFRMFRLLTTIGATSSSKGDWFDFWLYWDDFVLATSEADLPSYDGSPVVLYSPTNFRIVQ